MTRWARRAIVIGLGAALLASVALAATALAERATKPHLSDRRILEIGLKWARSAADPHPTLIQHTEGTGDHLSIIALGGTDTDYTPSILILERGHFVLDWVSTPGPNVPAPKGTVLSVIVSARTGRVTAFGLSEHYPDLKRYGPVHTDLRSATATTSIVFKGYAG